MDASSSPPDPGRSEPGCLPKALNLALQGGGAHGAFTWGVLDRLLQEPDLRLQSVTGTSAGAMNAVCLADGMGRGGREEARQTLARFWKAVSDAAALSPIQRSLLAHITGSWSLRDSPGYLMMDLLGTALSPYQLNPLNLNPLRDVVEEVIDFDAVRACPRLQVFITATNVHTGHARVFRHNEVTVDAVMASACLPQMFQAVEIDGVPYWDGGYMGNPALWPLIYHCTCRDVLLVQINPLKREETPRTSHDITNRLNEITFNASLLREMRAIAFVRRLLDDGALDPDRYKRMRLHVIEAEDTLKPLEASSKMNAEWAFLQHLHGIGMAAADTWIRRNWTSIGVEGTVDLEAMYL